jgi:hypothetical protein
MPQLVLAPALLQLAPHQALLPWAPPPLQLQPAALEMPQASHHQPALAPLPPPLALAAALAQEWLLLATLPGPCLAAPRAHRAMPCLRLLPPLATGLLQARLQPAVTLPVPPLPLQLG